MVILLNFSISSPVSQWIYFSQLFAFDTLLYNITCSVFFISFTKSFYSIPHLTHFVTLASSLFCFLILFGISSTTLFPFLVLLVSSSPLSGMLSWPQGYPKPSWNQLSEEAIICFHQDRSWMPPPSTRGRTLDVERLNKAADLLRPNKSM